MGNARCSCEPESTKDTAEELVQSFPVAPPHDNEHDPALFARGSAVGGQGPTPPLNGVEPHTSDRILALAPFDGRWVRLREVEGSVVKTEAPPRKRFFGRSKTPPPKFPPEMVKIEEDMAEIRGGVLTWSARYGAAMPPTELDMGRVAGEAAVKVNGQTLVVQMATENGLTMRWSDGDVWQRHSASGKEANVAITSVRAPGGPQDRGEYMPPKNNVEIISCRVSGGPEDGRKYSMPLKNDQNSESVTSITSINAVPRSRVDEAKKERRVYRNALPQCYASAHASSPRSKISQPQQSRPFIREFDAQVKKGLTKIGMDMVMNKDRTAVIVAEVKTGAVHDFNTNAVAAGEGGNVIKRGDRIVEVDGCCRGDAEAIVNALKSTSTTISLSLVRLLEFKLENLPNVPRGVNGFKFANGPEGELMLVGFAPAANKALKPDLEFRNGDCVVKVNGKSGTATELTSEIDKSDAVSLRVRRNSEDAL